MIVEMRTYKLKPGARARFLEIFQSRSVPAHTEIGMRILGPFPSIEDPDTFFFMRGFPDIESREPMKARFYEGELWKGELENVLMPMIEKYDVVVVEDSGDLMGNCESRKGADLDVMGLAYFRFAEEDRAYYEVMLPAQSPIAHTFGAVVSRRSFTRMCPNRSERSARPIDSRLPEWESRRRQRGAPRSSDDRAPSGRRRVLPIMADQREGWKAEFNHHLNRFRCHCALGVGKVVVRRSGGAASAVSAQVCADHGMIPGKLWCEVSPHQACPRKTMNHENCGTLSIAAIKDLVAGKVDLRGTVLRVRRPHE
jgi:hypothetical protein